MIGAILTYIVNQRIPYPWVYDFYNTEKFGAFEEVISKDYVSVIGQWRKINSKIAALNVPTNEK